MKLELKIERVKEEKMSDAAKRRRGETGTGGAVGQVARRAT